MYDWKDIENLNDELIGLRREIHKHPELGFEEFRTAKLVAEYLRRLDLEVNEELAITGVTGLLRGNKPGKTILLRADLDALPIEEQTGLSFCSVHKGVMHACGHDAHVAMLLVAAKALSNMRDQIQGNILFVFQPNEEVAGAADMIKAGALDGHDISACLTQHIWTQLPTGSVGFCSGGVMAGMEEFHVKIQGKAGHTGAPHLSIDPILAATDFVQTVQKLQTRDINPLSTTVIMFGQISAGTVSNAIADSAELHGTIRCLYKMDKDSQERPLQRFEQTLAGVCATHGAEYELEFVHSNKTVYNDAGLINTLQPVVTELFGSDGIHEYRSMAGEDFSEFSEHAPSVFTFLGCGNADKGTDFPHHHPRFDIDEDAMINGVKLHIASALHLLNSTRD